MGRPWAACESSGWLYPGLTRSDEQGSVQIPSPSHLLAKSLLLAGTQQLLIPPGKRVQALPPPTTSTSGQEDPWIETGQPLISVGRWCHPNCPPTEQRREYSKRDAAARWDSAGGGLQLAGLVPGSPVGSKAAVCLWAISLAPGNKGDIQKVRLHDGL